MQKSEIGLWTRNMNWLGWDGVHHGLASVSCDCYYIASIMAPGEEVHPVLFGSEASSAEIHDLVRPCKTFRF